MAVVAKVISGYVPELWAACLALVLFGLLAAGFWIRYFRSGRARYMVTLCIGTTTMAVGFAIRIGLVYKPSNMGIYIGTTLFTLLSPCAFLAHDYITLPRLAKWLDSEDCLFLTSRLIVRIFVWSDVTSFLMQAAGGGLSAVSSMAIVGTDIALAGLILQCVSFGIYILLIVMFGLRVMKRTPEKWTGIVTIDGEQTRLRWTQDWRVLYWALLYTCIGIMIRCIYRVAEFAEGYHGHLRTTEVFFYVLDSLPLFCAILVWIVVWPTTFISQPCPFLDNNVTLQATAGSLLELATGSVAPKEEDSV